MKFISSLLVLMFCGVSHASYDNTWYQTDFWSGEYPNGFSVTNPKGAVLSGRTGMDTTLPRNIKCKLPSKATFHPWNESRNKKNKVSYYQASQIVPMVAAKNFDYKFAIPLAPGIDEVVVLNIKKGEIVNFLVYYAEGAFRMSYQGKEYEVNQDLLEEENFVASSVFDQKNDEWLSLTCNNGKKAWLLLSEVMENTKLVAPANIIEYGKAEDLN